MVQKESSTDWGCVLPALLLAGFAIWGWIDYNKASVPAPLITTQAVAAEVGPTSTGSDAKVEPARASPSHNYDFVEEDAYGYIAAVSEEDRKRGKVAGNVVMYRYAGFWDGEFHLERLTPTGEIMGVSTCTKPCVAIKSYHRGSLERIAYDPASIVGGAMEDAITGRLKRKARVRAPETPNVAIQDQTNAPSNAPASDIAPADGPPSIGTAPSSSEFVELL